MALSRTGPPREGFEYQDLYGVIALLDWLAHPANYAWIKFEAREYGSLDDFVVCDPDRNVALYQVKHTGETPNRAEFETSDLLDVPASGKSLFEKWYRSWVRTARRGVFKSVTPILKTNKPASSELSALTISVGNGRAFDVSRLKSAGAAFYDQFAALTNNSNTAELDQFLSTLRFEFALPDIPVLRELAEERCRAMSLHLLACRDLEDEVWQWAKHGSELTLADIKRACGWFEARGREQRFPMPTDYLRLGGTLINGIVKTITAVPDGAVRVLVGAPGSGKSTFLEDLYDDLSKNEVPAIRHHYFVPGADKYDRLKFRDAAEAIVHELERKLPSGLPATNPVPDKLDEVLASAARMLRANNKSLVLILDGLDHVTRDEDQDELVELLRKVLRRASGLWIILGTRDFPSSSRVARLIEEHAPRDQWLIMPRFDKNGCRNLLAVHRAELHLDNDHHFDEIASAFFSITDGYPLHARYVLTRLSQISNSKSLQASDIQKIPSFGGDVPGAVFRNLENSSCRCAKHRDSAFSRSI